MDFGGTGRPADAVASRISSEKDDDIARQCLSAYDILARCGGDYSAELHMFGHIAGMIDLFDITGRKTDLVAVGTVSAGCLPCEFALRQLAGDRVAYRYGRIRAAGDTHRLIDVGTAGKRITDRAAKTCRGAAERLDLGRMVVCLVLEHQQPFFGLAVHIDGKHDTAGIDLIRLFLIRQSAFFLETAHRGKRDIHETQRLLLAAKLLAGLQIVFIRSLDRCKQRAAAEFHIRQDRAESRMTAVIGPVCIQHADLRHGRIPVLCISVIILCKKNVRAAHRKTHIAADLLKLFSAHRGETVQDRHVVRYTVLGLQRLRLIQRGFTGIHAVDAVFLNCVLLLVRHRPFQDIDLGIGGLRLFMSGEQLDALHRGVRTLVVLSRQVLDSENKIIRIIRRGLFIDRIHRRLRQDPRYRADIRIIRNIVQIITVQDPRAGEPLDLQVLLQILVQPVRLNTETFFFLDIYTTYRHSIILLI